MSIIDAIRWLNINTYSRRVLLSIKLAYCALLIWEDRFVIAAREPRVFSHNIRSIIESGQPVYNDVTKIGKLHDEGAIPSQTPIKEIRLVKLLFQSKKSDLHGIKKYKTRV